MKCCVKNNGIGFWKKKRRSNRWGSEDDDEQHVSREMYLGAQFFFVLFLSNV